MNNLIFLSTVNCISDCGGADMLKLIKFVWTLLELVLFAVPIGLIIIIMIDFMKNVMAGKEDEMRKNVSMVIKRIIYCVVLFLVPTIVNFAISLLGNAGENAVSTAAGCIELAQELTKDELQLCKIDYENLDKEESAYKCWKCADGSGYVFNKMQPNAGYTYSKGTSFNYNSATACGPGFNSEPVDASYCGQ